MKKYTLESCHEIGYSWSIKAPETLSEEDIKALSEALIYYTDTPSNEELCKMLEDDYYTLDLDLSKLEEFKKVDLYIECVHRDYFLQGFSKR